MKAGALTKKLVIQQPNAVPNGYGEDSTSWLTLATVFGSIEPLHGRELLAARELQSDIDHRITIRYLVGVTAKMQIVFEGRIFDIQVVLDTDMRHRELTLMCLERT